MSTPTVPLFSEHWLPRGISSTSRSRSEYLMYARPAATMDLDAITNETSNRDTGFLSSTSRSHIDYLMYALPAAMMDLDAITNESANRDTGFISSRSYFEYPMSAFPVAPYYTATTVGSSRSRFEYPMSAFPIAPYYTATTVGSSSSHFEYLMSAIPVAPYYTATTVGSSNRNADSCQKSFRTRAPGEKQSEDVCPICLDDMNQETVAILECHHEYHEKCIRKWLVNKESCPNCRAQV